MNYLDDKYYLKYLKYKKKYIDLQNSKNVQTGGLFATMDKMVMKAFEPPLTTKEKEAKIKDQKRQDKAQKETDIANAKEFEKYVASEIKWLNTKRKDTTECEQLLSELKVLVNALEITSSSSLDNYIIFGRYKDAFNKIMDKIHGEVEMAKRVRTIKKCLILNIYRNICQS
jgi:hypothetical protein